MIYLLGYVVAKINQDVSVQRSMVWQLTSVVWCFDLDGTLHQQDMFGSFALFTASPAAECVTCPAVVADHSHCVIDKGRAARWPMSLLLWGCTFGHNEARLQALQADFVRWFRDNVTAFPLVQERLTTYLLSSDADIWLITGSPQPLVESGLFRYATAAAG